MANILVVCIFVSPMVENVFKLIKLVCQMDHIFVI